VRVVLEAKVHSLVTIIVDNTHLDRCHREEMVAVLVAVPTLIVGHRVMPQYLWSKILSHLEILHLMEEDLEEAAGMTEAGVAITVGMILVTPILLVLP
jgi:hypothetical protein